MRNLRIAAATPSAGAKRKRARRKGPSIGTASRRCKGMGKAARKSCMRRVMKGGSR